MHLEQVKLQSGSTAADGMMEFLATFLLTFAAFIFAIRFYVKSAWRRFTEDVDMLDKTVIVTGGNAGEWLCFAEQDGSWHHHHHYFKQVICLSSTQGAYQTFQ